MILPSQTSWRWIVLSNRGIFLLCLVSQPLWAESLWLKGDLHVHSDHSTDASDSTVTDVLGKAEQLGMDFLAITDHDNHVEGRISTWYDPNYKSSQMVLLYGTEWTTGAGHANLFSKEPYSYQDIWDLRDSNIERTLELSRELGLHFSVNHPQGKDKWEPGFDLPVDSTEVWTAVFGIPNNNRSAIEMWDRHLMTGKRLTARGGSDSHHQNTFESQLFNIGNPTTWVRVSERSAEAILKALKDGHVSIAYAANAERIDLQASPVGNDELVYEIGDNVAWTETRTLRFQVDISGFRNGETYDVEVYRDGKSWRKIKARSPNVEFEAEVPAMLHSYFRVEVRASTPQAPWLSRVAFDRYVGMTNPIYFNY